MTNTPMPTTTASQLIAQRISETSGRISQISQTRDERFGQVKPVGRSRAELALAECQSEENHKRRHTGHQGRCAQEPFQELHAVQWREFYRGLKLRTFVSVSLCSVMESFEIAATRNSPTGSPTKTVMPLTIAQGRVAANKMPCSFGSGGLGGIAATVFEPGGALVTAGRTAAADFTGWVTVAAAHGWRGFGQRQSDENSGGGEQ